MNENHSYHVGNIVYVFHRNPHTQDVANVQSAAVVNHPKSPNELALFLYEDYLAVYSSDKKANQAYNYYYGDISEGTLNE